MNPNPRAFSAKLASIVLRAAFAGAALALPLVACSADKDDDDDDKRQSTAELVCEAMAASLEGCAQASPCNEEIVADCTELVGVLSEPYLAAVKSCLQDGGAPLACLSGSLGGLPPSAGFDRLVSTYCEQCLYGVCPDEVPIPAEVAGMLSLISDAVLDEIAATCTSTALQCTTFPECAKSVIVQKAIPEKTLACLLDSLANPSSAPGDCGGSAGAGGSGAGGSGAGGSGAGGSGACDSGAAGDIGSVACDTCVACTEQGPCESEWSLCGAGSACDVFWSCLETCDAQCGSDEGCYYACVGESSEPNNPCSGQPGTCIGDNALGCFDWYTAVSCSICDHCPGNCNAAANCY